ncbi:MAG: DUF177 domain-containing protein [bacterium]
MIIKFNNFPDGVHEIMFDEPCSEIGLGEPFFDNVKVKCRMDKSHSQLVLNNELTVRATFECDRCMKTFDIDLTNKFKLIYLCEPNLKSNEEENLYFLSPDADKIDISEDVNQFALLTVPMKKLCSEDCKGLCPECGKDLNLEQCSCQKAEVNPVWDRLKDLKINNKKNKKE